MIKNFISIEEQAKIELIEDILYNYIPTDYEMLTAIEYLKDEIQDTYEQLERITGNPLKPRNQEYIDILVKYHEKVCQQLTELFCRCLPWCHQQSMMLIK